MSWLQNTFRGLLFKNVAFNLTIQVQKNPRQKNPAGKYQPKLSTYLFKRASMSSRVAESSFGRCDPNFG